MYTPNHFKVIDFEEIRAFIEKHSFGTIVTAEQGTPIATHLPLQLHKQGDNYYITGHMAYGNSQWKTMEGVSVLVIYQGPHAYISSSWYREEDVPTWNYQAVHVYGTATIMDDKELQEDLILLLKKYESHREYPVLWEKLSTQTKQQIKGIVGFKVKVEEVQASYKLSQTWNEEDYHNIIDNLNEEQRLHAQSLAEVMKKEKRPD
ncbi:FMN-binding negative transcriptional regulator [Thalassobacillus devorans]|uniref:FMN-binding negative transcriptional regulator n=1 Tax=Thalassobacillus devorans TaxID=279813 RepID=UPI000491BF2A|nr:FMN-binding negative transcriptional regulator [Thalassobacillus devorans]